jgi:hypothetical protein
MAEPEDMIVPLLREMRAGMVTRLDELGASPGLRNRLLAAVDSRRDAARLIAKGDLPMNRLTLRHFSTRLEALGLPGSSI